jgi:hypothetical protein
MTPSGFAKEVAQLRSNLSGTYFDKMGQSEASQLIRKLQDSGVETEVLKRLVDVVLTDSLYTTLIGLDGSAVIGFEQHSYKLYDQQGNLLAGNGELEGAAYEYLQKK